MGSDNVPSFVIHQSAEVLSTSSCSFPIDRIQQTVALSLEA